MFDEKNTDLVNRLIKSLPDKVSNIIKRNEDLEEISKELLGESMSEDILKKVIEGEIYEEVIMELMGALYGK
tara:strand:- start:545 stop:760 length:216 start_codon:yes stop_codon:yes gene_type:complete